MNQFDNIHPIIWENDQLSLLDQRLLPGTSQYVTLHSAGEVATAIRNMVVRGAPAIGITAAYGIVLATKRRLSEGENWRSMIDQDVALLANSRPTAVNLFWAIDRMMRCLDHILCDPPETIYAHLLSEAKAIHEQDIAANHTMGQWGAALISPNSTVLTHCNAGALATGGFGTALGVIRAAWAAQRLRQVYADETRPWLQGARLTAWELTKEHIPVTLICEAAAATLFKTESIDWVIVGADRIAANGDVANKIGTYSLAVLARYHGVKMMVVAPTSTVDMNILDGQKIPIEHRSPKEILQYAGQTVAASEAQAWNPAFDVTPAELVDVIVTEKGVIEQPSSSKMREHMQSRGI